MFSKKKQKKKRTFLGNFVKLQMKYKHFTTSSKGIFGAYREALMSKDCRYILLAQGDGNVVIYKEGHNSIWDTDTHRLV